MVCSTYLSGIGKSAYPLSPSPITLCKQKFRWERILARIPQVDSIKYGPIDLSPPADIAKPINRGAGQRRAGVSNLVAVNEPLQGVLMLEYVFLRQFARRCWRLCSENHWTNQKEGALLLFTRMAPLLGDTAVEREHQLWTIGKEMLNMPKSLPFIFSWSVGVRKMQLLWCLCFSSHWKEAFLIALQHFKERGYSQST